MAEASFSEDGKYFATITSEGRLRIWDTETNVLKQEFTPNLHLTAPPSCLQWLSVTNSNASQPKPSKNNNQEHQCIALGTTNGKILLYSVTEAKISTVLIDQKRYSKVTCVDWNRKYGLYSCSKENFVTEWDIQNASVRNKYNINIGNKIKQGSVVSAIKLIPHNQNNLARYIVASSTLVRVLRLLNGSAVVIKNLGHNAAPKALLSLASLDNKCWLVEGSQNERLLSFWDVTITEDNSPLTNGDDLPPTKKKRKKSITEELTVNTPAYNFVLEDAPKILDVNVNDDNGSVLRLSAATRSGVVHYYDHMLNGPSSKPIKPTVTIQVTTEDATPLPLQCCRLSAGDLQIGYICDTIIHFEKITPDTKTKTQILIRGETKETKKQKNKQKIAQQANNVNKIRTDVDNKEVSYAEPVAVSRKRVTPGATTEVPMEERLSNLTLDVKSRSKSAVDQNLTKLLVQGLHSNDNELIMMVLQRNDARVAARTVAALPPHSVGPLLDHLADMARRNTSQCVRACTWVCALVRAHAALLLAAHHADVLATLLATFAQRRSHLCQLLNLKGRVELALNQREKRDAALALEQQPLLVYNDTSSDEELEVEKFQSESEHEMWEESGEEGGSGEEAGGADGGGGESSDGD